MAGYHNYSMSNNAVMAYQTGEMPKSKWTKTAIINALIEADAPSDFIKLAKTYSVNALREALLYQSSWHHTSMHYNKTNFYSVEEVYEDNVADFIDKLNATSKESKVVEASQRWEVEYIEWAGSRRHPKAIKVQDVGIVTGNWFVSDTGKRKKVDGNHFQLIKRLEN